MHNLVDYKKFGFTKFVPHVAASESPRTVQALTLLKEAACRRNIHVAPSVAGGHRRLAASTERTVDLVVPLLVPSLPLSPHFPTLKLSFPDLQSVCKSY